MNSTLEILRLLGNENYRFPVRQLSWHSFGDSFLFMFLEFHHESNSRRRNLHVAIRSLTSDLALAASTLCYHWKSQKPSLQIAPPFLLTMEWWDILFRNTAAATFDVSHLIRGPELARRFSLSSSQLSAAFTHHLVNLKNRSAGVNESLLDDERLLYLSKIDARRDHGRYTPGRIGHKHFLNRKMRAKFSQLQFCRQKDEVFRIIFFAHS